VLVCGELLRSIVVHRVLQDLCPCLPLRSHSHCAHDATAAAPVPTRRSATITTALPLLLYELCYNTQRQGLRRLATCQILRVTTTPVYKPCRAYQWGREPEDAARTAPGGPGPCGQLYMLALICYNLKWARACAQRARRATRATLKPACSFRAARHLAPLR
jgi:hypothetical protein